MAHNFGVYNWDQDMVMSYLIQWKVFTSGIGVDRGLMTLTVQRGLVSREGNLMILTLFWIVKFLIT